TKDGRAFIVENGIVKKEWKIPNSPAIRAACWTSMHSITIGLGNGRILEYNTNSIQQLRDYSRNIGQSPIIMTKYFHSSNILMACSNTRLMAYKNGQEFDLMVPRQGEFDKILAISIDETSLHFVVGSKALASWETEFHPSFNWATCLLPLKNSLYSFVSTTNGIAIHDWSRTKEDLHVNCRASIVDIRATAKDESSNNIMVLSEKNMVYLKFGLTRCNNCK
ncbi:unnamed protein product, partial [Cylicostephanus goldi]